MSAEETTLALRLFGYGLMALGALVLTLVLALIYRKGKEEARRSFYSRDHSLDD